MNIQVDSYPPKHYYPDHYSLSGIGWFPDDDPQFEQGAHVIFDGQYGSTGKGLLAQVLADVFASDIHGVTTSAGPNSGHTCYIGGVKCVLHQLPTAGVVLRQMGYPVQIFLNAGAVVSAKTLREEIATHILHSDPIFVHPNAANARNNRDVSKAEEVRVEQIGSTGQGVGEALREKISRDVPNFATVGNNRSSSLRHVIDIPDIHTGNWLVETAQGWSLGINQPFYPYVTSRECGVAQALADLGIAPKALRKSIVSLRTYPIRVAGKSGEWYPDQREIAWSEIGQQPELTSTTKKERRIATWSRKQYVDMLRANRPDAIFINFLNYLIPGHEEQFVEDCIRRPYYEVMGRKPDFVLGGWGKDHHNVKLMKESS